MKSLNKFISEQLIFELSDELLKKAANAARERGTAIEKRRAKEFENWLNNPKRKKIQELNGKSKQFKEFEKISEKYLKPGIETYNEHNANDTSSYLENFYDAYRKYILETIKTEHIEIAVPKWDWQIVHEHGYLTGSAGFKPHWKKNNWGIFNNTYGIAVKVKLINIDSNLLQSFGYKTSYDGKFAMSIGKDGTIYANVNLPYHCIPIDYKNELEEIVNILNELNAWSEWNQIDNYLGDKSIKEELKISDFFMHLNSHSDFTQYDLEDGLPKLVNKITNFFKMIDSSSKVEWINKKDFGGYHSFTAELKLIYKGKDYELEVYWEGDYQNTSANIKANGTPIFNLDYKTTNWDAGLYSNDHYKKVSKEIDNIFK